MVSLKKDVYSTKIINIEDKVPDITNLANKTTLNANDVKGEIPNITKLQLMLLLMLKIKFLVLVI